VYAHSGADDLAEFLEKQDHLQQEVAPLMETARKGNQALYEGEFPEVTLCALHHVKENFSGAEAVKDESATYADIYTDPNTGRPHGKHQLADYRPEILHFVQKVQNLNSDQHKAHELNNKNAALRLLVVAVEAIKIAKTFISKRITVVDEKLNHAKLHAGEVAYESLKKIIVTVHTDGKVPLKDGEYTEAAEAAFFFIKFTDNHISGLKHEVDATKRLYVRSTPDGKITEQKMFRQEIINYLKLVETALLKQHKEDVQTNVELGKGFLVLAHLSQAHAKEFVDQTEADVERKVKAATGKVNTETENNRLF